MDSRSLLECQYSYYWLRMVHWKIQNWRMFLVMLSIKKMPYGKKIEFWSLIFCISYQQTEIAFGHLWRSIFQNKLIFFRFGIWRKSIFLLILLFPKQSKRKETILKNNSTIFNKSKRNMKFFKIKNGSTEKITNGSTFME